MKEDDMRDVEAFAKLAELAQQRFDSRRNIEWKAAVGIWSLFGVGAAAVIAADTWTPNVYTAIGGTILSVLVVGLYWRYWLPYLAETFHRDQRVAYFWQSAIEARIGRKLAMNLDPGYEPDGNGGFKRLDSWTRIGDVYPEERPEGEEEVNLRPISPRSHAAQRAQLAITVFFAAIFIGALFSKYLQESPSGGKPRSILLLQGNVEVDEISKIRVRE